MREAEAAGWLRPARFAYFRVGSSSGPATSRPGSLERFGSGDTGTGRARGTALGESQNG